jgi:hypothetical protein
LVSVSCGEFSLPSSWFSFWQPFAQFSTGA